MTGIKKGTAVSLKKQHPCREKHEYDKKQYKKLKEYIL